MKRLPLVLFGGTLIAVTWLALTPRPPPLPGTTNDKVNHFVAFVVLAFLFDWAYPRLRLWTGKLPLLLAYGLAIEILQAFIPNRDCSLADWLTDAAALLVYGVGVVPLWRRVAIRWPRMNRER